MTNGNNLEFFIRTKKNNTYFTFRNFLIWKNETTNVSWKKDNLNLLIKRMSGWQLETFKESYEYKVKTGVSLYKQNLKKIDGRE